MESIKRKQDDRKGGWRLGEGHSTFRHWGQKEYLKTLASASLSLVFVYVFLCTLNPQSPSFMPAFSCPVLSARGRIQP